MNSYYSFLDFKTFQLFDPRINQEIYTDIGFSSFNDNWVIPNEGDQCWANLKCSMAKADITIEDGFLKQLTGKSILLKIDHICLELLLGFFILLIANFLTLFFSKDVDVDQLIKDFESLNMSTNFSYESLYVFISFLVTILSLFLIYFFRPFSEMYLIYYFKVSYYFFINLVSISSIFIVLRIVGYSRLNLLIYLITMSIFFFYQKKYQKIQTLLFYSPLNILFKGK